MYNDKVKTRNPIAKTLRNPKYRARVVRSKKVYSRKGNENETRRFERTIHSDS